MNFRSFFVSDEWIKIERLMEKDIEAHTSICTSYKPSTQGDQIASAQGAIRMLLKYTSKEFKDSMLPTQQNTEEE